MNLIDTLSKHPTEVLAALFTFLSALVIGGKWILGTIEAKRNYERLGKALDTQVKHLEEQRRLREQKAQDHLQAQLQDHTHEAQEKQAKVGHMDASDVVDLIESGNKELMVP